MKTLSNPLITITGNKLTLTADIVDQQFNQILTTRVSHGHVHGEHHRHKRDIQSSSEAVFVKYGCHGAFALTNDFLIQCAAEVEPRTSFAPVFKEGSSPKGVAVISETSAQFQWQVSDDPTPKAVKDHTPPPPAVWTDIPGATKDSLDEAAVKKGQWVRCVAVNATGKTISQPAKNV
jgi:hypothetical protein